MASDIIVLRNDLVSLIQSNNLPGLKVAGKILVRTPIGKITGKNLWLFPGIYTDNGPSDRTANVYDLTINAVFAEKYTDDGIPPDEWVEDRIEYVENNIFNVFSEDQTLYGTQTNYWSQGATINVLYDAEMLDEHKLFWSELEFVFRKLK